MTKIILKGLNVKKLPGALKRRPPKRSISLPMSPPPLAPSLYMENIDSNIGSGTQALSHERNTGREDGFVVPVQKGRDLRFPIPAPGNEPIMIKRTWNLYEPLLVCDANLIRSPGPCNRFLPNPDPGWCRLVQPRVTTDTTPTLVTRDLLVELDDELLVPRSLAADQGYITPYSGNTRCPPPPAVESNHPRRSQGVFGLAHTPVPIWAPPTTIGEPPVQGIRPQLAPWRRRPPACLPSPPSRIDARLLGFSPSAPCQTHLPLPDLDHRWTPCEEDAALLGPPLPASKSSDSSALTSSRRGLWPGNHRQSPWKDTIRRLSFDLFPGDDLSEAASDTTTASPFRMALSKLPNLCPDIEELGYL